MKNIASACKLPARDADQLSGVPLIELRGIIKQFDQGGASTRVLHGIDLTINHGEFVAIVGASGSGKSTLMNIIGCLDTATGGEYRFEGRNIEHFSSQQLADLRSMRIGFIFQRYHLIPQLDAVSNVEVPAVYAGCSLTERRQKARQLLCRIGLSERASYYPNQLSGGQQQRISIARALINHPDIILADEPTGALDSASGQEILQILEQLHAQGFTVIIITHDPKIAAKAQRVVTIQDGRVIGDEQAPRRTRLTSSVSQLAGRASQDAVKDELLDKTTDRKQEQWRPQKPGTGRGFLLGGWEMLRLAAPGIMRHKVKTFLTMLGIIIGIASVATVVALGEGSKRQILSDIAALGNRTVAIFPGKDWGDVKSGKVETLIESDVAALAKQPYVAHVSPVLSGNVTVRYADQELSMQVHGVDQDYFKLCGLKLASGRLFKALDVQRYHQVVVIDDNSYQRLFGGDRANGASVGTGRTLGGTKQNALGRTLFIGKLPCKIIGVTRPKDDPTGRRQQLEVWMPYATFARKVSGRRYFNLVMVQLEDYVTSESADASIQKLLTWRHGRVKDFFTATSESIMQTITQTANNMTMLISAIAAISLLVGGIGVMNIMLVSVTERTKEIGIRLAVGAQTRDVLLQFILEAVLLCLLGGVLGLGLAWAICQLLPTLVSGIHLHFSWSIAWVAMGCSSLIGTIFGYLPARRASKLTPIAALASD